MSTQLNNSGTIFFTEQEMNSIKMATVFLAIACCSAAIAQESNTNFDDPVFLKVGDAPMNAEGEMMYPSPVMFDVDNDGADELVIGTIFGGIYACENSNQGDGDPIWESPVAVNSAAGEPLRLNNW